MSEPKKRDAEYFAERRLKNEEIIERNRAKPTPVDADTDECVCGADE